MTIILNRTGPDNTDKSLKKLLSLMDCNGTITATPSGRLIGMKASGIALTGRRYIAG